MISKVVKLQIFLSVLRNGITFGGRHYEFLCFSASQLRYRILTLKLTNLLENLKLISLLEEVGFFYPLMFKGMTSKTALMQIQ